MFSNNLLRLTEKHKLLDILWASEQRPSILIILSHLETEASDEEPMGPRILTIPRIAGQAPDLPLWLLTQTITRYEKKNGRWESQPIPLVLLMACDSVGNDLAALSSFVKSFSSAGASAVIGTECDIFSDIGARFAKEITDSVLLKKKQLGQAIQDFNQLLIKAGNPLIFSFTCFGNANLTIT
jgi:hypothetical protein